MKKRPLVRISTIERAAWRLPAAILLLASMSGCMTLAALSQIEQERTNLRLSVFDAADHAWSRRQGRAVTGSIRLITPVFEQGQAGGVQRGRAFETLTCGGHRVRLIPDTPHMRWLVEREFRLSSNDGGYWKNGFVAQDWAWPDQSANYVREARCEPSGDFRFESVPDGKYLVMAEVDPPSYYRGIGDADIVLKPVIVRSEDERLDVQIGSDSLGSAFLNGPPIRH